MRIRVTNQGFGLAGEEAAQWLDRLASQIRTREPGSHAQVVERHREVLRQFVHSVLSQLREDCVKILFEVVIAECIMFKNMLTTVGGTSPYQAAFGRVPPLVSTFETASLTQLGDVYAGRPDVS